MSPPLSVEEFDHLQRQLKIRKAPGWDYITNEHVKYLGENMKKCIVKLFNLLVRYECIPDNFKIGIIIPIPKGNKCVTRQDNYRGITLQQVLCKLFKKWIMSWIERWSNNNQIIHSLQGANHKSVPA